MKIATESQIRFTVLKLQNERSHESVDAKQEIILGDNHDFIDFLHLQIQYLLEFFGFMIAFVWTLRDFDI